jgi:hypothetical protein
LLAPEERRVHATGVIVVEYDARVVGTTLLLPQEAYRYRKTKEKTDFKMA